MHGARQACQWQLADRAANGFIQAGGGLAGGRRQANAVLAPGPFRAFPGYGLQGSQQVNYSGGFTGTRAAGNHRKAVAGRQGAGQFLVIHRFGGPEQRVEGCG